MAFDTLDGVPCAVLETDRHGGLLNLNAGALALLGGTAAQWQQRPLEDTLPAASRIFLQTHLLPTLARDGRIAEALLHLRGADGQPIPVLLNAHVQGTAPAQTLVWALFVAHQRSRFERAVLDTRRRAEADAATIAENQRFTRSVTDTAPNMIAYWDLELRCRFSNHAYETALGLARAELEGRKLDELPPTALLSATQGLLAAARAGQRQEAEHTLTLPDGSERHILSVFVPDWAAGEVRGVVVQASDISSLKTAEQALRNSQSFLERTGLLAGVGGWEMSLDGPQLHWSDAVCRMLGVPANTHPSRALVQRLLVPQARLTMQMALQEARLHGTGFDLQVEVLRADDERRHMHLVASIEQRGPERWLVGAMQDVTERVRLGHELAQQHELLRVTLQSIGDAVITTDAQAQITWLNPVAERLTGWLLAEAAGRPVTQVFHLLQQDNRQPALCPVQACLDAQQVVAVAQDCLLVARNGTEFAVEDSAAPILDGQGHLVGAVLVFHDVSEQRRLSGEMSYRAKHDPLTGLVNRTEFEGRLQLALDQAPLAPGSHALMAIDLDQFKLVNDACGHAAGDLLLKQVARLLGEVVRSRDTLARLGGDEFALLLEHCTVEQAERVATQICARMDEFRFVHDERRFRIGASIGLVPVDGRWPTVAAVMQAGDTACYAAKEAGRNRVHTWHDTDQSIQQRQGQMQWVTRLEQALDGDQFQLFAQRLQPLREPARGVYAEVLLRLPEGSGWVPPGVFLPAAERFHLAARIDRWVLQRVLRTLSERGGCAGIDTLCVNLSGQSVGDRAFHRWLVALLEAQTPLLRQCLCLEITETVAVINLADAALFVEQVRALGVRVALDDFGAGASSFGYLKRLGVDVLKIDGQFIQDLIGNRLNEAAVRCFVEVAQAVSLKTVAEFVDQPAVLARLHELGVDYAQGYLLHRPEPIEAVLDTVTA